MTKYTGTDYTLDFVDAVYNIALARKAEAKVNTRGYEVLAMVAADMFGLIAEGPHTPGYEDRIVRAFEAELYNHANIAAQAEEQTT